MLNDAKQAGKAPIKETQIGVRLDAKTRTRLERRAARKSLTLSSYIRALIDRDLRRGKKPAAS